jgi:hypothetical protein
MPYFRGQAVGDDALQGMLAQYRQQNPGAAADDQSILNVLEGRAPPNWALGGGGQGGGYGWGAPGQDPMGMPRMITDPAFNAFYAQQQAAGLDFPAIMDAWAAQQGGQSPGHVLAPWPTPQAPDGWYGGQGVAGAAPMQAQMTPLAALGGMYGPLGGLGSGMAGALGGLGGGMAGGGWNALLADRARPSALGALGAPGALQPLSAFAGTGRLGVGGLFGR